MPCKRSELQWDGDDVLWAALNPSTMKNFLCGWFDPGPDVWNPWVGDRYGSEVKHWRLAHLSWRDLMKKVLLASGVLLCGAGLLSLLRLIAGTQPWDAQAWGKLSGTALVLALGAFLAYRGKRTPT